jgi:ferric-dicitrate binding protein FerR (iron transport regulator)
MMNISKELLYRFFNQESSSEEQQYIKRWMEESEENSHIFFEERKLYDAIILDGKVQIEREETKPIVRHLFLRKVVIAISGVAALLAIAAFSTFYFTMQSFRHELANVITVPQGQRTDLMLSDGTKVCLNANTRFEYPATFKSYDSRKVKIDGEAYFEVSKDVKHPFIVESPHGKVQVLGTKFYIESYSKKDEFITSLIEGVVRVSTVSEVATLHRNERGELKNGRFVLTKIDDFDVYRWREGLYCFKDMPLQEVFEQFEKYYNVKFIIRGTLPDIPITGKFRLIDGVDFALKVLQKGVNFKFKRDIDSNNVYIY